MGLNAFCLAFRLRNDVAHAPLDGTKRSHDFFTCGGLSGSLLTDQVPFFKVTPATSHYKEMLGCLRGQGKITLASYPIRAKDSNP